LRLTLFPRYIVLSLPFKKVQVRLFFSTSSIFSPSKKIYPSSVQKIQIKLVFFFPPVQLPSFGRPSLVLFFLRVCGPPSFSLGPPVCHLLLRRAVPPFLLARQIFFP